MSGEQGRRSLPIKPIDLWGLHRVFLLQVETNADSLVPWERVPPGGKRAGEANSGRMEPFADNAPRSHGTDD